MATKKKPVPLIDSAALEHMLDYLAPHLPWYLPKSLVRHILEIVLEHFELEVMPDA